MYTLKKMKDFLATLSEEQLKQRAVVIMEDCPVQDLYGHEIKGPVYGRIMPGFPGDFQETGTIEELRESYGENWNPDEHWKQIQPDGKVYFY